MNSTETLQQADRCVKCGLCLAVCPTYALLRNEADSPRGRIALIQGLMEGDLEPSRRLAQHLNGCLHCLNCQNACPSGVEYNRIIDAGLGHLQQRRSLALAPLSRWGQSLWTRWLPQILNSALQRRLAISLTRGRWRRMLELLPPHIRPPVRPDKDDCKDGQAALFLGCIGQVNDSPAQQALIQLCTELKIDLCIPPHQGCCGALHRHHGDEVQSDRLGTANQRAFSKAQPLISLSSGCAVELRRQFGPKLVDASAFLASQPGLAHAKFAPLHARVAVHTPCSLRNGLGSEKAVWQLLESIPAIRLVTLENSMGCCGGAGLQLLEQAEMADALVAPLVTQVRSLQPDYIVTSNSGCALHLRRALRQQNLNAEVLHPVELLARQWPSTTMQDK